MKPKILILIGLIFVILSCNNDNENSQPEINGEYVGIFERGENSSNVELTFNNGNWNGESETEKFPALCNGNYSISGNVITFENACPCAVVYVSFVSSPLNLFLVALNVLRYPFPIPAVLSITGL